MVLTKIGASIEGKKLAFQCRKFYLQRPYKEEKLKNILVYPVRLSIFGIAVIDTELNPKEYFFNQSQTDSRGSGLYLLPAPFLTHSHALCENAGKRTLCIPL